MRLELSPQAYYDLIVQPSFSDIPQGQTWYGDTMHLWRVIDNVSLVNGLSMVDVFKKQNFLKRKDRSCETVWSKVATTGARKLTVTEVYSATQYCQEEFYDGGLKDLRAKPEVFRNIVFDLLEEGDRMDMLTNNYFGDKDRADDPNGVWNWNTYDGVVVKIAEYNDAGVISDNQILGALPDGVISPTDAYNIFKEAFAKRTDLMKTLPELSLEFTVDQDLYDAYEQYLVSTGALTTNGVNLIMNGIPTLKFNRIPIYQEKSWNPILRALNGGTDAHMCILTISGQFTFGTNTTYGGGENLDQAVRVWYSKDDDVWKKKMDKVAGTQLRSPQHTVFGITDMA